MPRHPPRAFLRIISNSSDSALVLPHEQLESTFSSVASSHSRLIAFFGSSTAVISICLMSLGHDPAPGGATGAKETRTPNIQLAKLALYQLSYNPDSYGPEWT